jgi:hypothetical protein
MVSAHQQRAGDFATHQLDLIFGNALRHQFRDEHLEAIGVRRIGGLSEVSPEDEILRTDGLDGR